jgi:hypothetical protein
VLDYLRQMGKAYGSQGGKKTAKTHDARGTLGPREESRLTPPDPFRLPLRCSSVDQPQPGRQRFCIGDNPLNFVSRSSGFTSL